MLKSLCSIFYKKSWLKKCLLFNVPKLLFRSGVKILENMKNRIFYIICMFISSLSTLHANGLNDGYTITRHENVIELELEFPEIKWEKFLVENQEFVKPHLDDLPSLSVPGYPQLPIFTRAFALAPNESAYVEILDSVVVESACDPIYPALSFQDETKVPVVRKHPEVYDTNTFFPHRFWKNETGKFRDSLTTRLTLFPLRYNAKLGRVKVLKFLKLRIMIVPATRIIQKSGINQPHPFSWYDPNKPYLKIITHENGVYSLSGRDLLTRFAKPILREHVKLYIGGHENPIWIEPEPTGSLQENDRLYFWISRRKGDNSYYHPYSDDQVAWLTIGDSPARRYSLISSTPEPAFAQSSITNEHFEVDRFYHAGNTDSDVHRTEQMPGEGWIWAQFLPGDRFTHQFDLPDFDPDADSLVFNVLVRGTTFAPSSPDHHLVIHVNDHQAFSVLFNDREEKNVSFAIPSDWVKNKNNVVTFESLSLMDVERSHFYLDWFTIQYKKKNVVSNGFLQLSQSSSSALLIRGFKSANIKLLDVENAVASKPSRVDQGHTMDIKVSSAGLSDGNYALFHLDGINTFSAKRGYNLVGLDHLSGDIVFQKNFDTWLSPENVTEMITFLHSLPDTVYVLFAIRDEGSHNMTEEAYEAIEQFGSQFIRQVKTRDSWAMIGRKNGSKDQVLESHVSLGGGPAVVHTEIDFQRGVNTYRGFWGSFANEYKWVAFDDSSFTLADSIYIDDSSNLSDPGNSAEYIIITTIEFLQAASRLKNYHENENGLQCKVVQVNDIYDEFNYGLKDPFAIKSFLEYAYEKWSEPKLRFVLLLGDASWDAKQHFNGKQDFVPTYGHPVSDVWYGCFDGPDDILPEIAIGRIPAETLSEAQQIIDKIIAYHDTPSHLWKKTFTFINGGFDRYEQKAFYEQSRYLAKNYVQLAPIAGKSNFIDKTSEGYREGENRQEILDRIDEGTVWLNFIGHAGSATWDLMFHNPDIDELNNARRYPFISSMTCHTGRFAEPSQSSFGEIFLRAKEKGAVSFLGTSGWGFAYEDFLFLRKFYPAIVHDGERSLGDALNQAKWQFWQTNGGSINVHNMILQYNLLGDPAMRIAVPEKPDLLFESSISLDPKIPSESDSTVDLQFTIQNAGLACPDSFNVQLYYEHPDVGQKSFATVHLDSIDLYSTFSVELPISDLLGQITVRAILDPENTIDEVDETNNTFTDQFTVLSRRLSLISPPDFALLDQSPVFRVQDPMIQNSQGETILFQIDSNPDFSSPDLMTFESGDHPMFFSSWDPEKTFDPGTYYWRVRPSSDSLAAAWAERSFTIGALRGWTQTSSREFERCSGYQSTVDSSGITLAKKSQAIYVESAGYSDGVFARLLSDNKSLHIASRGHNMVVLDPVWGAPIFSKTYDTYRDSVNANQMAEKIRTLEPGSIVLLAISDEGSLNMTENAYQALESLGSTMCRKVGGRDSWALIGKKGAAPGSVPEAWVKSTLGTASVSDTLTFYHERGTVTSPRIGPTSSWKELTWQADVLENTSIYLDVVGVNSQLFVQDTLFRDVSSSANLDLSGVDAARYPEMQLIAHLNTRDGRVTPALKEWQVEYDPVP
ncbi:hypothetical protein GF406_16790, partial [candidate division KSB1 bacterium]|nr:hypothetical protein [candidate division KSB1 bacterium]